MSADGDMSEEDRVQAAEYVLSLLDAPIARAFEQRMAEEPELRQQVVDWEHDFSALADEVPDVVPPGSVWTAVSRELFGEPERRSFWSRIGLGQAVLGAAAAAAVAFVVMQSGVLEPVVRPDYRAELSGEAAAPRFLAEFDVESGKLFLTRLEGDAPPGRSLEFWLIAGGNAPVSVMVWPTGAESEEIILPAPLAASLPGGVLAISDEPEGGSPTGAPTGAVLATGEVQEI
ncbi:MAG: anti-sigma factor [Pseudooceanicola sp.]